MNESNTHEDGDQKVEPQAGPGAGATCSECGGPGPMFDGFDWCEQCEAERQTRSEARAKQEAERKAWEAAQAERQRTERADFFRARQQRCLDELGANTPPIYRDTQIDRLPYPELAQHVMQWQRYDEDCEQAPGSWGWERPGLLLVGKPGAGKTRLAYALAMREAQGCAYVRVIKAVEWGSRTSARAKDCELEGWAEENLTFEGVMLHCLVIDDLDKAKNTEAVASELFNLIECATANGVALICTTNMAADKLAYHFGKEFGSAIVRRIKEFCTPVKF